MSLLKNIQKYKYLHSLINRGCTGNAKELANKLGVTERQLYNYIQELRELNIPIAYDNIGYTYYYEKPVRFEFYFGVTPLNDQELNKTDGGFIHFFESEKNNWLTEILFQS